MLIGRGQDYAWSATSSTQDITDTYAVPLCDATHYIYNGQCVAMEEISHTNSWRPSTADSTPAGSYELVAWRTRYGLVSWRGTVGGQPYAFTTMRSTYGHEADSAIGFQMYNDAAAMGSAAAFQTAASNVLFAFNWFYVNATETAYFNSGRWTRRCGRPSRPGRGSTAPRWCAWSSRPPSPTCAARRSSTTCCASSTASRS